MKRDERGWGGGSGGEKKRSGEWMSAEDKIRR